MIAWLVPVALALQVGALSPVAPGDSIAYEIDGTDAAAAQTYVIRLYEHPAGGARTAIVPSVSGVVCSAIAGLTTTFTCQFVIPSALTFGTHSLTVTAQDGSKPESIESNTLSVQFSPLPTGTPRNLRVIPKKAN